MADLDNSEDDDDLNNSIDDDMFEQEDTIGRKQTLLSKSLLL